VLNHLLSLQHADSAFPTGGFAFSNGIEALAALGPLDDDSLAAIITAALRHRWASSDRIALIAAYRANGDIPALAAVDAAIEAATLAETFRLGSRRHGQSFLAAHARLRTPGADTLAAAVRAGHLLGHVTMLQGALWRAAGLDEKAVVAISGYQAIASMTTAAVRLGRIGALDAQRVMAQVLPLVSSIADDGDDLSDPGDDGFVMSSFIPLIEIAAARHAHADLHLFSN
jgi:urease accessory protein